MFFGEATISESAINEIVDRDRRTHRSRHAVIYLDAKRKTNRTEGQLKRPAIIRLYPGASQ